MKNRIYVLLIYIFLIGCMPIFSVGNKAHTDPKVQIMQPSSDAQSLGKFAEIPVDLYTEPILTRTCWAISEKRMFIQIQNIRNVFNACNTIHRDCLG